MDRLEMMRIAEKELGRTATAEQMAGFIQDRFGESIGPKFIPIIRSSLRGQEALLEAREQAIRICAEDAAEQAKPKVKRNRRSKAG